MTDRELVLRYAPILHFDAAETIPLLRVGYTVLRKSGSSPSFSRNLDLKENDALVIEYAYFWDYDIQHMYDLEHIWVWVGQNGHVTGAQASFHGKYLNLYDPLLPGALPPENEHVHAFCQPGKHAFLPAGELFRMVPGWYESCNTLSGGEVLVGSPFHGVYGKTDADDRRSARYIREHLAFVPTLRFAASPTKAEYYVPWEVLFLWIPRRIAELCAQLEALYGEM